MKFTKNALVVSCLLLLVMLSACGGGSAAKLNPITTSASSAAECPSGDYKSALVAEVNAIRARPQICGGVAFPAIGALGWDGQLESAAAAHSTDMVVNNFFAHPGSDGSRIGARANAAGYAYSKVGENIAAGQSSAAPSAFAAHCRL